MKQVERSDDGSQKIVEVMRHSTGELAECFELRHLMHVGLGFGQALLIPQAIGHVVNELVGADPLPTGVAERVELHFVVAPVVAGVAELAHFGELLAGKRPPPDRLNGFAMLGHVRDRLEHRLPHFRPYSIDSLELVPGRPVDRQPAEVEVGNLDEGVGAFDDVCEDLLFSQRLGEALTELFVRFAEPGFALRQSPALL